MRSSHQVRKMTDRGRQSGLTETAHGTRQCFTGKANLHSSGHHDNRGGGKIGKQVGFKKDLTLLSHIFRKSNEALMESQDTYSQQVEEILRAPSPTLHPSPDFLHSPSDGDWIGQCLHPTLSPPSCCLRTDSNAREDHK